ncbi:MAG: MBL fold metallo-hydrolase [Rhodospirillales bacterium]|nr:MAG: MBL fold metallo-hydrolase [Rhodospirillales bacterium]
MPARIDAFFDPRTFTVTYLVADPATGAAAVVDPVLDFDPKSGRTSTTSIDRVMSRARETGARVEWVLETHAHADHLSGAQRIKAATGARIGIGAEITRVQETFKAVFNAPDMATDGSPFDALFADGARIPLGGLEIEVMHTPGHTPACVSYRVGADVFVGDTLFMPDYGTARCDFPGGDARTLYRSIQRVLALPPETTLHLCHDYKAPGREAYAWTTTVAAQRAGNVHVRDGVSEDAFVAMRAARDAKLDMPTLILPSIQVNVRAGNLPPAESNGTIYLKLPVDLLG